MNPTDRREELLAVIDIGSSAIRMMIAEVADRGEIRTLENLQMHVPLGKDVFSSGRISTPTLREAIRVLRNFKSALDEYGVRNVQAIATSAVREAANRDNFVDQVFVRTGIDVEVIEGAEENRLGMISVEHALEGHFDFARESCLILEVGSGSTVLILLNRGEVELTRTLTIGSVRLPGNAMVGSTDPSTMRRILHRSIHEIASHAGREHSLGDIDTFIAVGAAMRFVTRELCDEPGGRFAVLPQRDFERFVDEISALSADEIVDRHGLDYGEAETIYASLLFYRYFLGETSATNIVVPAASIREGVLLEQIELRTGHEAGDVARLVLSSAMQLGRKFDFDEKHATCVASAALKLFDSLKQDHGLGSRQRLLLHVAAILHEIGMYVSPTGRHKHSAYLIDASDIFGLRASDKRIVAQVARYHRRAHPRSTHEPYMSLPKHDRATVSKLAALLRIAAALDGGRDQRLCSFELDRSREPYVIWVPETAGDITLERDAVVRRGRMFAEVFGTPIVLRSGSPGTGGDA
jgi:exopolyphosphatase/guanosine-5'-triphosphate,3'-diphosphate pyrophosphatase